MLGECPGQRGGELQVSEVVAICDHLLFFFLSQLEQEVLGKAVAVATRLLVETLAGTP
jgi:hypothetical protein